MSKPIRFYFLNLKDIDWLNKSVFMNKKTPLYGSIFETLDRDYFFVDLKDRIQLSPGNNISFNTKEKYFY